MADITTPADGRPARPRPPPRRVVVEDVRRLTPRVTCVTFAGPELARFGPPRPGAHMKVFFPAHDSTWMPGDETTPRPPLRTYTPLRHDATRKRLDVEFVHHGDGVAATWAGNARAGDRMFVAGPGGGYDAPPQAGQVVLVADETAMPAAGSIIDSLPKATVVRAICEIENAAEERQFSARGDIEITWLHRAVGDRQPSSALEEAVRTSKFDVGSTAWWIACEAGAMRRIRQHLLRERSVEAALLHTRGYWKLGQTAYPDHDYGKD